MVYFKIVIGVMALFAAFIIGVRYGAKQATTRVIKIMLYEFTESIKNCRKFTHEEANKMVEEYLTNIDNRISKL